MLAKAYSATPRGVDALFVTVEVDREDRLAIIGGERLSKRHIWWNFVSSSRER